MLRALKRVTGRTTGTDEDFFRILPALPRETQDYVPKLIAAARIGNAQHEYGLTVRQVSSDGDVAAATPATSSAKATSKSASKKVSAARPKRHTSKTPVRRAATTRQRTASGH